MTINVATLNGNADTDFAQTITSSGGANSQSLISKSDASSDGQFQLKGLRAGHGLTVLTIGNDLVISDKGGGNYVNTEQNYTIETENRVVGVDVSSSTVQLTLPLITNDGNGKVLTIKDESDNANSNNITVVASGSDTIEGSANHTIDTDGGSLTIYANVETQTWYII